MATAKEADATCDSRTASIGIAQARNIPNDGPQPSSTTRNSKRKRGGRKNRGGRRDMQELVPKGTTFSNSSLGSNDSPDSTQDANTKCESVSEPPRLPGTRQSKQQKRTATNWNNLRKGAVRTSLRGQDSTPANTSNSFQSINGTYWRSRSASASSTGSEARFGTAGSDGDDQTDDSDSGANTDKDNSIVLNIDLPHRSETPVEEVISGGSQFTPNEPQNSTNHETEPPVEFVMQSQPVSSEELHSRSEVDDKKEAAIQSFNSKYKSSPQTLADLTHDDLEIQAKCTECLKEGHLADICPTKECEHCHAWNSHESRFCPQWRRCQKCRERGHDREACTAPLQGSASEVPCDLCGSDQHLEFDCDLMWRIPQSNLNVGQIFVSICCAHCTSPQHLIGDCPRRPFPMNSSSWSLKTFDPSMVSNISQIPYTGKSGGLRGGKLSNFRVKGRAHQRDSSPEDDGFFAGPDRWAPINQEPPNSRTHIRFAEGIGRGRGLGPTSSRPPNPAADSYIPNDHRRDYRDREQFFGSSNRQRSLSPDMNISRQRGGNGNQYIPPKLHSGGGGGGRGRGGPPSARGHGRGRGGGPSGRGRGASGNVYRPMPVGKRKNKRNP